MQRGKNAVTFVIILFKMLEKNAAVTMEPGYIVVVSTIAVTGTLQLVVEPDIYVQEQLA